MTCIRGSRYHINHNAKKKDKKDKDKKTQPNKQKRDTFKYGIWWYYIETVISRDNYTKKDYVNSNILFQSAFKVLKSFVLPVNGLQF